MQQQRQPVPRTATTKPELGRVIIASSGKPRGVVPRADTLRHMWRKYHLARGAKPLLGAVVLGGAALTLASEVGALELAIGALTAYTAYRMLRYGLDLKEALTETVEIEKLAKEEV